MQVTGTLSPPGIDSTAHTQTAFEKIILIGKHGGKQAGEPIPWPRLRILGLTMITEDYKN